MAGCIWDGLPQPERGAQGKEELGQGMPCRQRQHLPGYTYKAEPPLLPPRAAVACAPSGGGWGHAVVLINSSLLFTHRGMSTEKLQRGKRWRTSTKFTVEDLVEKSDILKKIQAGSHKGPRRRHSNHWHNSSMSVISPGDLPAGQDMEVEGSDIDDADPSWLRQICVFVSFIKKMF